MNGCHALGENTELEFWERVLHVYIKHETNGHESMESIVIKKSVHAKIAGVLPTLV